MASKQYNGFKQIEQQYGGETFTTDIDIDNGNILFQTSHGSIPQTQQRNMERKRYR